MAYNRGSILTGQVIDLRVTFTDDAGNLVDPDAVPDVYIYDESVDSSIVDTEAIAKTYTSALAGPLVATKLSTGYYEYQYTVPSMSTEGTWKDLWVAQIDGADVYHIFKFTVSAGANLSDQAIGNNTLVVLELTSDISNADNSVYLQDVELYYSTTYSPLYASPALVRAELGKWIDWIPDDTLALMIHWSSKEAKFVTGAPIKNQNNYKLARTKYVIYDAALRTLMIPGQGGTASSSSSSGGTKKLGDLSIKGGSSSNSGGSSTLADDEILMYIRDRRDEWFRVVNAGGNIVPGQGLDPAMAIKGAYDPDRRVGGRLWESQDDYHYPQPGINGKAIRAGRRRGRFAFYDGKK